MGVSGKFKFTCQQWVHWVAVSIATENGTFTVIEGTNLTTWDGFSFDPNL